jgi:uncharacterized damage-inducible protein DinB
MSAATLLHSLFQYKAWANVETFAELAKLDTDARMAERHSAIRILNHIYVVDRIWAAHLSGVKHHYEANNTAETPTLQALRDAVIESDRWYVDYTSALSDKQLTEHIAFTFTDGEKGRMSREEILAHVATHGGYHRGAAGRIMVQADVQPPRDSLTVYLHKMQPERRTQN